MGIRDGLADLIEAPFKIGSGVVEGAKDTASLVDNVLDGDWGGAFNDGFKLVGDANDLVEGISALGGFATPLPTSFYAVKNLLPADSKILWAAQQTIEGMKKTTGSGQPCNGDEFRGSSERLQTVVDTLISAEPHEDKWDGTASQVYNAVNASHRRVTSEVQNADLEVAKVLDIEAGQVTRTRETLDDQIEWLKVYDVATFALNATPLGRLAKLGLDTAAAAAALGIAGTTMSILVKNSVENALSIREHLDGYANGARDTSGNPDGGCEIFAAPDPNDEKQQLPRHDQRATPLPDPASGTRPPSRSLPTTEYTVPSPEEPIVYGPPATPYAVPTPTTPSASGASAPAATAPPVAPAAPAQSAPASPSAPRSAPPTISAPPAGPGAAAPAAYSGGRAPVNAGLGAPVSPRTYPTQS
ncbi:EspA/EspE family type VII secretion system effector [Mycolicibacterium wolinskyi]|uniref:EspA/EspE family type VII secretion system effector n=1 Tax=Mycolicibacterium wolinskyi TaxID=59750 RepID=UPI000831150A|nr:EspA/EspE family type VII secretion system effector [Mycolicibacterium wolinskyi]